MNTPEQWDIYSTLTERTIDTLGGVINCHFKYQDYEFDYDLKVQEEGVGFRVSVILDKPVPENLVGKAGLNMEFFPATYYGKTYLVDGQSEIFPRYPSSDTEMRSNDEKIPQFWGLSTFDDRGRNEFIVPKPISKGHTIVVAPEDESLRVLFQSDTELNLFDGRNLSQNGTYWNLSHRACVIAWLKACVLYVANGLQWEKAIEDFVAEKKKVTHIKIDPLFSGFKFIMEDWLEK